MMSNEGYNDRILTCRDCGQDFTFSAGEQEFYASRSLTNDPSRCPACRAARRSGGGQSSAPRSRNTSGEYYETICADCGRTTSVPCEDRPVYCSDCFQSHRPARSGRRDDSRSYSSSSSYGNSGSNGGRGGRDRRDTRERRDRW